MQSGPAAVGFSVHLFVAFSAQRDQVVFLITAGLAAEFEVMYLQVLHATADLGTASRRVRVPCGAIPDNSWQRV